MPVKEKKTNIILVWITAQLTWVASILVIILLLVGYFWIISPKIKSGQDRPEGTLEEAKGELATQQAKLDQLQDLIQDYKSLSPAHFKKVEEFLPTSNDGPIIFTHLDALARANDSALLNVSVSELSDREVIEQKVKGELDLPENIKVVTVVAEFLMAPGAGNYPFFKQLITSIEDNIRLFDIEYINFSPIMESMNINASTYYLNEL